MLQSLLPVTNFSPSLEHNTLPLPYARRALPTIERNSRYFSPEAFRLAGQRATHNERRSRLRSNFESLKQPALSLI
jgi:hypothetical protein